MKLTMASPHQHRNMDQCVSTKECIDKPVIYPITFKRVQNTIHLRLYAVHHTYTDYTSSLSADTRAR